MTGRGVQTPECLLASGTWGANFTRVIISSRVQQYQTGKVEFRVYFTTDQRHCPLCTSLQVTVYTVTRYPSITLNHPPSPPIPSPSPPLVIPPSPPHHRITPLVCQTHQSPFSFILVLFTYFFFVICKFSA